MSRIMENKTSEHKTFEYRGFTCERKDSTYHVTYDFSIPGVSKFHPSWDFPIYREADENILNELLFHLGMVEAISYWKCICPRDFYIKGHSLSNAQLAWWRKLFYYGLGEFMFVNGLEFDYEDFIHFHCEEKEAAALHDDSKYNGCLVPVGGGKDSVVTLELLKNERINTYCVNGNATTENIINAAENVDISYVAKRRLDPKLLELNKQGYLNGHTPFSAIVAFSSYIAALLSGKKYIALSNEDSANESTVRDSFVNHQYSKTYEFETDFCNYIKSVTNSDIHYFSMLRPLSELGIARLFSKCRKYHPLFRSCNVGSKKGIWCLGCAKCLFVYIILTPFLSDSELVGIFGENLLDKPELENDFKSLLGLNENKPFECVGTRDEVRAALSEFTKTRSSYLTEKYKNEIGYKDISDYLNHFSDNNSLPEKYLEMLKEAVKEI